jgi:hypothetical protein
LPRSPLFFEHSLYNHKFMFRTSDIPRRIAHLCFCALFTIVLFASITSAAQEENEEHYSYSMERVKTRSSSNIPAAFISQLEPLGYRVLRKEEDGDTKLVSEIFWAKTVHIETTNIDNDVVYGNVKQGSLIGVVHFLIIQRYVRDYRSQDLRPGYYTMRYAVMPQSPTWSGIQKEPRDFVLLTPVRADRNAAAALAVPELIHRSRLASPIHHPVAMSLVAVDPDEKLPSLITDDEGTSVLQVRLHRSAGTTKKQDEFINMALTVITAIPEDLGD